MGSKKRQRKQKEKIIVGLTRQRDRPINKVETLKGRKDTTSDYWRKEIKSFEERIDDLKRDLED